jgi:hypothetical protein
VISITVSSPEKSHIEYTGMPEKNEMGGACSTYGGKERCIQDFGEET